MKFSFANERGHISIVVGNDVGLEGEHPFSKTLTTHGIRS
jgi:hypothetical protein